ncbi:hypothetical protein AAE478_010287 [Parahypoxylon ruwenzoriense]
MDMYTEAREGTLTAAKLKDYLSFNNDIDAEGPGNDTTLLATAVKAGRVHVAKILLDHGADVDKKTKYGCTPLYIAANARAQREEMVQLLLDNDAKIDLTDPACDNETPLMVAITKACDPKIVEILCKAGASLQATNSKGETAQSMAEQSADEDILCAITPSGQLRSGLFEWVSTIVSFVLFIFAYVGSGVINGIKSIVPVIYGIGNKLGLNPRFIEDIDNPTTDEDFEEGVNKYIEKSELGQFFSPGNEYLQNVAKKALELRDDPNNHLKKPDQIKGLVQLALYQPVFYCDDSGSMNAPLDAPNSKESRMDAQRGLVKRMACIATRLVPDDSGAHLRFINRNESELDDLNGEQLESKMLFAPKRTHLTNIGTELEAKILQPMIYDVLDRGDTLKRPFLILTITDGQPNPELPGTLKDAIIKCGQRLTARGYPQEAVMFLISQVGNDCEADKFLDSLAGDPALDRVLFRTAGRLNEKYSELRENDQDIEEWVSLLLLGLSSGSTLFNVLMKPILSRGKTD